jgi:hypothetical protein
MLQYLFIVFKFLIAAGIHNAGLQPRGGKILIISVIAHY